ncbi:MAG TPA: amidohydrolase [Levilinea sp.]|nr:amidohydrolase [Levilinea sp.]
MAYLIVHNCDILHVDARRSWVDLHQDIVIDGQRIARITPANPQVITSPAKVIDAGGMLAIPGMVNTHAHVPMALFRGLVEDVTVEAWFNDYIWPLESNLTAEDVYWGALLGIAEMIEAGVTSVADHYFAMDEVAQAVCDSGLRANLAWAVFGHEGAEKLDRPSRFIQDWQGKGDGRITTWLGPHAPYTTSPDFLRLCAQRAAELGVGIHIHVSETAAQVRMSLEQYGLTPVQQLHETGVLGVPTILAHCAHPTDEDIRILAGKSTGIAHAPKTFLKLGAGIVALKRFREMGIPVGLASDGAASNNTLDILEQARLVALLQKHLAADPTDMPVHEVLRIAFHGGAQVLGMDGELGELAPGKLADIALLRQDGLHTFPRYNPAANLVYSSRSADVDTVICHGQVLMSGRQLLTIDRVEVKRQVSQRLARLTRLVPEKRIAVYPA